MNDERDQMRRMARETLEEQLAKGMPDFRERSPSRHYRRSGWGWGGRQVTVGQARDAMTQLAASVAKDLKKSRRKAQMNHGPEDYRELLHSADLAEQLAEMLRSYVWDSTTPRADR